MVFNWFNYIQIKVDEQTSTQNPNKTNKMDKTTQLETSSPA